MEMIGEAGTTMEVRLAATTASLNHSLEWMKKISERSQSTEQTLARISRMQASWAPMETRVLVATPTTPLSTKPTIPSLSVSPRHEARMDELSRSIDASLAKIARLQKVKEQEGRVATMASFATTGTSTFVQDQVREKPETKPLLPSLISTPQVLVDGALNLDTIHAPVVLTRCSTLGSAGSFGNNHAVVAIPTSGTTDLPATTISSARNCMLQGVDGAGMNTVEANFNVGNAETHDTNGQQLMWCEATLENVTHTVEPPVEDSAKMFTYIGGLTLFPELCDYVVDKVLDEMPSQIVVWDDDIPDDVVTQVGGMSLFLELGLDSAEEIFAETPSKDTVSDDELADSVLTHIGGLPLFLEQTMDAHQELEQEMDNPTCLHHGLGGVELMFRVVPSTQEKLQLLYSRERLQRSDIGTLFLSWDPGAWTIFAYESKLSTTETSDIGGWSSWLRRRSNQDFQDSLRNTKFFNQGVGLSVGPCGTIIIKLELGQRVNCSQGIHMIVDILLGLIEKSDVLLDCTSLWPIEVKMDKYGTETGHLSIFPCQKLKKELQADNSYIVKDTLGSHFSYTSVSLSLIGWSSFSQEENSEKGIMFMGMNIDDYGYALHSNQQSNLHSAKFGFLMPSSKYVKISWDPGDIHSSSALSSRLVQFIVCVALSRPWDPGIVTIHEVVVPVHVKARQFPCKIWSSSLLQPKRAIAWGQAMFLGGGIVTPGTIGEVDLDVSDHGPGGHGLTTSLVTTKEAVASKERHRRID